LAVELLLGPLGVDDPERPHAVMRPKAATESTAATLVRFRKTGKTASIVRRRAL
jgi:hypothetical protein